MDILWLRFVIFTLFSLQIAIKLDATQTFYMFNDNGTCSDSTLSGISSGRIKPSNGSTYPKGVNCEMIWNSTSGTKTLLLVSVDLADPENGTCVDVLEIYDPENETDTKQRLCGSNATKQVFEFSSAAVKFKFTAHVNSSHSGQGFTALVTSFTDPSGGNCSASEFLCDTKRCIGNSLECNGDKNCVDETDENSCSAGSSTTEATTSSANTTDQSTVGSSTVGNQSTTGSQTTTGTGSQTTTTGTSSQTTTTGTTNQILAAITPASPVLGDKALMVIIILASAIVVTLIITTIVYTVWFKKNTVGPDVETTNIVVKQAPHTPGPRPAPKDAPTTSKAASKSPKKVKVAPTEPESTPPARKGPAKKAKNLKKDAW